MSLMVYFDVGSWCVSRYVVGVAGFLADWGAKWMVEFLCKVHDLEEGLDAVC